MPLPEGAHFLEKLEKVPLETKADIFCSKAN